MYIGKAKNLFNRVRSYFNFSPTLVPNKNLALRISKMISETYTFEFIVTDNEKDALILENSLIKQLKPKYNILLRDDKTFPYIYINLSDDFPRFVITRKTIKKKGIKYFGPFTTASRQTLGAIYDSFPLVQSASCLKGKKRCLYYQINKCLAPCEGLVDKDTYATYVNEAMGVLNNKNKLISKMNDKMNLFAKQEKFEEAMELRNTIKNFKNTSIQSAIDLASNVNIDIFVVENKNNKWIVLQIFMRQGKVISSSHQIIFNDENSNIGEIYKNAIINYYKKDSLITPDFILIAKDVDYIDDMNFFIADIFDKKIDIQIPQKGEKKKLIDMARKNAFIILDNAKNTNLEEFLLKTKKVLKLNNIPYRIEAFDNSHHSSQASVGSMVVYENNAFDSSSYRQYKLEANYEYEQMKEMLSRRVSSFYENPAPDLWVIDGGSTLLKLAKSIIGTLNIDIIAIAKEKIDAKANRSKGRANDIIYLQDGILKLQTDDKVLHFMQRLRDESHRFAIKNHRKLKLKEDKNISLMNIKGIKEAKIRKLISYFGTFDAIKKASQDDIANILNDKDAVSIIEYFKGEINK